MSISSISAAQQRDMLAQMRELRETRAAARQAAASSPVGTGAPGVGSPDQAGVSPPSDKTGLDASCTSSSSTPPVGSVASKLMKELQPFLFGDGLNAAIQAGSQGAAAGGAAGAGRTDAPSHSDAAQPAARRMLHRMAQAIETYEARGMSAPATSTTSTSA